MTMFRTKRSTEIELPKEFTPDAIAILKRIEQNISVKGVMYFKNDTVKMYTVPQRELMVLSKKLPIFITNVEQALKDITATINKCNPMVDRIMDDKSVEGVIMTNKDGAPILTNISLTQASLLGRALRMYVAMIQMFIKELDPFEEVMVVRISTRKNEMILAPDRDFLVVVIQLARKLKDKGNFK